MRLLVLLRLVVVDEEEFSNERATLAEETEPTTGKSQDTSRQSSIESENSTPTTKKRKKQPRSVPKRDHVPDFRQSLYNQSNAAPEGSSFTLNADSNAVSGVSPIESEASTSETAVPLPAKGQETNLGQADDVGLPIVHDDDDDDIEVLDEQIVSHGTPKRPVQVLVDPEDIGKLKNLGFDVIKPE